MLIELTIKKEFEIKYLQVEAGVRYWEDGTVNGNEDDNGNLIPCRSGDSWEPLIHLDDGKIQNWTKGTTAKLHYKVCDAGTYKLLDEDKNLIKEIDGYVPDIMCPKGGGYGDYIIMDINEDGEIQGWNPSFHEFENQED